MPAVDGLHRRGARGGSPRHRPLRAGRPHPAMVRNRTSDGPASRDRWRTDRKARCVGGDRWRRECRREPHAGCEGRGHFDRGSSPGGDPAVGVPGADERSRRITVRGCRSVRTGRSRLTGRGWGVGCSRARPTGGGSGAGPCGWSSSAARTALSSGPSVARSPSMRTIQWRSPRDDAEPAVTTVDGSGLTCRR